MSCAGAAHHPSLTSVWQGGCHINNYPPVNSWRRWCSSSPGPDACPHNIPHPPLLYILLWCARACNVCVMCVRVCVWQDALVQRIAALLEERVRPNVLADGGDVQVRAIDLCYGRTFAKNFVFKRKTRFGSR